MSSNSDRKGGSPPAATAEKAAGTSAGVGEGVGEGQADPDVEETSGAAFDAKKAARAPRVAKTDVRVAAAIMQALTHELYRSHFNGTKLNDRKKC